MYFSVSVSYSSQIQPEAGTIRFYVTFSDNTISAEALGTAVTFGSISTTEWV
jgi:hypothetical protein